MDFIQFGQYVPITSPSDIKNCFLTLFPQSLHYIVRYNDADEEYVESIGVLSEQLACIVLVKLRELDHFTNKLNCEYINILTIEPIGFINYSSGHTGFRTVMYNVTFNWVTKQDVNGTVEFLWSENHTIARYMIFDVAVANDQEPMKGGNIYKFYYIYNAYQFYNVIYYEKIETGRID